MIDIVMTKKNVDFAKSYDEKDDFTKGLIDRSDYDKVKDNLEKNTDPEDYSYEEI